MILDLPNRPVAELHDNNLADEAAEKTPDVVVQTDGSGPVVVPGGEALLKGEFLRDGDDLLIDAADGTLVKVEGFFAGDAPPDIVVGGAVIPGKLAARLARDIGEDQASAGDDILIGGNEEDLLGAARDEAATQEASLTDNAAAQESVAKVSEFEGQVTIHRADGSQVKAEVGTEIFEDDVVTTGEGGSVGISFVDGMSFSLGEKARMLLDEFKYDPESHDGGGLLSVLQGQFSFVSGAAAHTAEDALMIETPTMTIGVRGTKVVAHAGAEGEVSRIALLAEEDGTVGKIMVTTDEGSQLISEANMMVEVVSRFEAPSPQVQLSSDQVFDFFNSAISVLPAPAEFLNPDKPAGPDTERGAESVSRPADAADGGNRTDASQFTAETNPQTAELSAPIVAETVSETVETANTASGEVAPAPEAELPIGADSESETVEESPGLGTLDRTAALSEEAETVDEIVADAAVTAPVRASIASAATVLQETSGGESSDPPPPPPNPAPVLVTPVGNQNTAEDGAFALDVSPSFTDPGDTLSFSATLAGGGALPDWLSINPTTGVLSGTPANGDVGAIDVEVTATDSGGTGTSSTFQLTVTNVNDAPTVGVIANTLATEDSAFNHDVSSDFADMDIVHGDSLTFSAELVGGAPLPGWLSINPTTGILSGTPVNGDVGVIDVKVTATDDAGASASSSFQIGVLNANDAPVLDTSGIPTLTGMAEDAPATLGDTVADIVIDGSISDVDGPPVEAIAVTYIDTAGGTWEYSTDGGATFNAIGSVSDNAALLLDAAARVRFVPSSNFNGSSILGYRAWDQSVGVSGDSGVDVSTNGGTTAFSSATEYSSITVTAVNDAPILNNSGSPTLTAIAEDAAAPVGDSVADIVLDSSIIDVEGGVEAIAVTGADDTNGTWEYSIDGGSTYNAIGAVSDSSALLLDGAAMIRFVPNADYNGTATFNYRAWDQSSGASGDSGVDASVNGGVTAFSTATETATITINAVNDAPTVASPIADVTPTQGDALELDVSGHFSDVDTINGDVLSFSATQVGGAPLPSWMSIDSVTGVISGTPGVPDIGSVFDVEVTATDLSGSKISSSFQVTVDAVNLAPVLNISGSPTLTAIAEDDAAPTGTTVADIVIDGSITDADGAMEAIAVTSVDNANGTWEYSIDGGSSYSAVGTVSDNSALLLDGAAMLRFVPNADYNGSATFSYRAWDGSSGANGDKGVDASVNGGVTAFSTATEIATITINAVNDAPVLDNAGNQDLTAINEDDTVSAGNTVAEIVVDGSITDVEGAVEAIAVTGVDDANGTWEYSTDGGSTFNAIGPVSDSSALLLDGAAKIRFVPDADFNGSATFTYRAWDQSSGASGDSGVDASTNGGATAFSAVSEVTSITVNAVNDAPVLDTSGNPTLTSIAVDDLTSAGNSVGDIVLNGSITDVEGAGEAIAVTGVDNANGSWEYSTDGGSTFNAIGAVSDSSALLLDATAKIRFVPNAGYDGGATFTYRAWDGTSGSSGDSGVDVSTNGGSTAFSAASETAAITVQSNTLNLASGSEFQVNTTTTDNQTAPSVTALDGGGYVVTWVSKDQDGDSYGVFGQRYDAAGSTVGSEFQINTETVDQQKEPSVAALDGGGFVVVWQSKEQDGHNNGVFGQRYDASGNAVGSEFQVNTETFNDQDNPDVAALDGGGFIVTWESQNQDGSALGVYGQRFDAAGNAVGSEFQVNTTTTSNQKNSQVVALSGGGFVVVWESDGGGGGKDIFAQRYDAAGSAVGSEFAVNSETTDNQEKPAIAALDDGGFVVAWSSTDQDGDDKGVFAQRYDASGNPVEFEFQVNSTTTDDQKEPSITALDDGGFLIAWTSKEQDGDGYGLYAQRFNADGDAIGSEFRVNTTTADAQKDVDLTTLNSGDVVAAWQSKNQDGDGEGVFAHQFTSESPAVTTNAPDAEGDNVIDFSGTNSYVDMGDDASLDVGTQDFTVEAWFYYSGPASGNDTIVSKGWGVLQGYNIHLDGNELVVKVNPGTLSSSEMAATKITMSGDPGWHHVAMVINQEAGSNASTVTGYLDGSNTGWTNGHGSISDNLFTTPAGGMDSTQDFRIGAAHSTIGTYDHFDGEIADVRVWNTARSQLEIQADMSRTLLGDEDHLIGNWLLDDGSGTTASNSVAGGVDGTLVGGPAWNGTTSFTMAMDGELNGRVTASDAEGDTLNFSVSGNAANGTATIDSSTGAWEYTPNSGYTGADNFSYEISDGNGGTDQVNISVVVS